MAAGLITTQGKAAQLKLNENVKADTIEEMMGMLKEAADQQVAANILLL
jgi:hypothetical protein